MLKLGLSLLVVLPCAAIGPAAALAATPYGPPSLKAAVPAPSDGAQDDIGKAAQYPDAENLLAANGIEITDSGARRPIAPNTEVAVEPARGLVNEFGEAKKPMRLLLRVGTNF